MYVCMAESKAKTTHHSKKMATASTAPAAIDGERMNYMCMYVCMYERMYACLYVCVYVCMYVCMNEFTYTNKIYRSKYM